jgi:gliding motility-associated-like protein
MVKRRKFGILLMRFFMLSPRYILLSTFFLFAGIGQSMATHLIGGYMSYEFLEKINNDYSYKITLYMFRDVEQSEVNFDEEILLGIYLNNTNLDRTQVLRVPLLTRKIVRPPGNEECEYYADNEIEMAFYEKTVTLPAYTEGYHITFVRCCRNLQDNLINDVGKPFQGQTYYGRIPNPALRNSSPRFSGVPSPYMCAKDTTTFLNRAVDKDGDSLVYRYVWPFQGGEPTQGGAMPDPPVRLTLPITPVQYESAYNYKQPFGSSGLAEINASNGLTTLYAPSEGSYVVGIEVAEYRNGILLSTVRLDMQILVLKCDPNNKPSAKSPDGDYFEVEGGQELCFDVEGTNADNQPQQVTIFATGDILTGENGVDPPLARMTTRTATDYVTSEFCWTPSCEQAREELYIVAITARDNGCPPKQDHINIEIKVLKFIGSDEILGADRACTGSKYPFVYIARNPKDNSSFWWEVIGGTIEGDTDGDTISVLWNGIGQGRIRMVEISQYGCPGDTVGKNITLIDAPSIPVISGKDTVCLNTLNSNYSIPTTSGSSYTWFFPDGNFEINSTGKSSYDWDLLGNYKIKVVEINSDGCASDTAVFDVNVRKPVPGIYGPQSVCPNSEDITYSSIGLSGSSYNWTITGGNQVSGGNSNQIDITWGNEGLGFIDVIETDKFGCVSDPIRYVVRKTYDLEGVIPVGEASVCEFDADVPYYVVEATGSIYRWNVSGGSQVSGDSTSNITITWGAKGLGTVGVQEWAYDKVNKKECVSPERTLDVIINPIPTADEIEGNFEVCQSDDTYTYTVKGFPGSTYSWTVNGSNQNIQGQGTSTISYVWDLPGSFVVTVQELSVDLCPGEIIDSVVVVHPKPVSDLIVGQLVHCVPNQLNTMYTISGFANSTFNWTVDNGTFTGGNNDTIFIDWENGGHGLIEAIEISEFGCIGDTLTLPVYINNIEIDLEVVSVGFPDTRMHGSWNLMNDDLTSGSFEVEKRIPGAEPNWSPVISESYTSFLETDINTDLNPFEYRIKGYDLCGNERYSEVHTSMLLNGTQDETDFSVALNFTPYKGWDNGVNKYELYKSVNSDPFLRFDQSSTVGNTIFLEGNSDNFRQCYRVKATEQDGGNKVSWSNEICFYFQPNVYVPTAFTPNSDGINDGFHPVSVAVQDYTLAVYNRWGQLVFQSVNQVESWDGTYLGTNSPSGIYMYLVTFTDYGDRKYEKTGTVQLMR